MESANLAMADMSLLHMVDPRVEDMVCNICILPKGGKGWGVSLNSIKKNCDLFIGCGYYGNPCN